LRLLEEMQSVITELAEAAKPSVVSLFPVAGAGKGREVPQERVVHLGELLVRHRPREIDAANLGADHRRTGFDVDRAIGHDGLRDAQCCPPVAFCAAIFDFRAVTSESNSACSRYVTSIQLCAISSTVRSPQPTH